MQPKKAKEEKKLVFEYFSNEDLQKLTIVLGIPKITEKRCFQLQDIRRDYFSNSKSIPKIPRPAKQKADLSKIRNLVKELIDHLEKLDDKSQQALWMAGYQVGSHEPPFHQIAKEVLKKRGIKIQSEGLFREPDIYKLYRATEKTLKVIKIDKGGRPKKSALNGLIDSLKSFFEEVTGREATTYPNRYDGKYENQFFVFVYTYLGIIDPSETQNKNALGKQIQKRLSKKD